jgi:RNase P subunit RPR2
MTQGKGDGRNPKFRILCKQCNSYLHTCVKTLVVGTDMEDLNVVTALICNSCGNSAADVAEEFTTQ